ERRVAQLTVGVVSEALVERPADSLRHPAFDLPLEDERVDDAPAVVDNHVLEDLEPERLRVDTHVGGVAAGGPRRARRAVVPSGLEPWLLAVLKRRPRARLARELSGGLGAASEGVAHRVGEHGHRAERNAFVGSTLHAHSAVDEL